ncbi:hypothetical protein [Metamycoplasma equirhinis]|uniref:hypothetical protein n=1 Tax=Metamycoplasma equirhinis TaxID=92402 RepID=UPI003593D275
MAKEASLELVEFLKSEINNLKMQKQSKWNLGVFEYALELAENLEYELIYIKQNKLSEQIILNENFLLNGAKNWKEFSNGGSSLIYNEDIANRLATKSDKAKYYNKKNNYWKEPSATETWLDVQARALFQASKLILELQEQYFNKKS